MMTHQQEPVTEHVTEAENKEPQAQPEVAPQAQQAAPPVEPVQVPVEQPAPKVEAPAPVEPKVEQPQPAPAPVELKVEQPKPEPAPAQPAPATTGGSTPLMTSAPVMPAEAVEAKLSDKPQLRAYRPAPQAAPQEPAAVETNTQAQAQPQAQPPYPAEVPTEEAPAAPKAPMSTGTPMAVAAANAHGPRKATKNEQAAGDFFQGRSPAQGGVATAQRPRHLPSERPSYSAPAATATPAPAPARQYDYSQGEAKYATYSKSEVDNMLKQQAETILSALSGKISAQQRSFQEAVIGQEKAFNKLSDNFVAQFEQARVKLENTAKQSQQYTKADLEEFNKTLSKELDQYRSQISKIVAKSQDGKAQAKQQEAAKPQNVPPKAQQALTVGQAKLQNLVMVTVVLSAASVLMSLWTMLLHAH